MPHDFRSSALSPEGDAAKEETRRMPLDAVRSSSAWLWDPVACRLRHDWMELAGEGAPTLQLLLDEKALGPAKYIGVDTDRGIIRRCRNHYGPNAPAEWHIEEMDILVDRRGAFHNVGVLIYDTEDGLHKIDWTKLDHIGTFAQEQAARLGEFLLVVNMAEFPKATTQAVIDLYLDRLSTAVGQEVTRENIHVYRSKVLPMHWTMVSFGF